MTETTTSTGVVSTSYTPGSWLGIIGESATVLLPPSEKSRAGALWALVDDGAGFDEVLDALVATGLSSLPGFVLVSGQITPAGGAVRIVVRGSSVASFETASGAVDVDGSASKTWVEHTLDGVTRMSVALGDEKAVGDPLTVAGGLVRVAGLEVPPPALGGVGEDAPATRNGIGRSPVAVEPSDSADDVPHEPRGGGVAAAGLLAGAGAAGIGAAALVGSHRGSDSDESADDADSAGLDDPAGFDDHTDDHADYDEEPAEPELPVQSDEIAPAPAFSVVPPAPISEDIQGLPTDVDDEPVAVRRSEELPPEEDALGPIPPQDEAPAFAPPPAPPAPPAPPFGLASVPDVEEDVPEEQEAYDAPAAPFGAPSMPPPAPPLPEPEAYDAPADDFDLPTNPPPGLAPAGSPPQQPSDESSWHEPAHAGPVFDMPPPSAPEPYADPYGEEPQDAYDPEAPTEAFPAPDFAAPDFAPPPAPPVNLPPPPAPQGVAPMPPPSAPPVDMPPPPPGAEVADAPMPPEWEQGPEDDHDGLTRVGAPEDYNANLAGIPGQPQAPQVTAYAVARLEFSNGDRIDVDRVVLVGRAPEAGRFGHGKEQPMLVTVPSPNQEISSTHCEIRPGAGVDHGAAVVTDLGSTNGTVLVQPGLGAEDLRPGVPVQLMPGALIDLGDSLTIRVTNP